MGAALTRPASCLVIIGGYVRYSELVYRKTAVLSAEKEAIHFTMSVRPNVGKATNGVYLVYTVEPPKRGHFGNGPFVLSSGVVPISEVHHILMFFCNL